MVLGAGCWGPGIHWDAENSAAFVGPRAGSWPYGSTCPITAKNGLLIDQNTGKAYAGPPMAMYTYVPHNTSTDAGSNLGSTPYILQPGGGSYIPIVSGQRPGYTVIPAYTCGPAGIFEYDSFTFDVTVGTNSSVSFSGAAIGATPAWQWTNTENPTPATAHDNVNNFQLDCSNGGSYGWTDEPWGAGYNTVPGNPYAGLILGSFQMARQANGYITTDSLIPVDTTYSGGFAMSFWFKPIAWGDGNPLFSLFNAPNARLIEVQLRQDFPNALRVYFDNGPVNPTGSTTMNLGLSHYGANTWNFFALSYNPSGAQLSMYCNSNSPYTVTAPYTPLWGASGMSLNSDYSYGFAPAGAYAHFRVWNRQLSTAEVNTLMTTPTAAGPSGQTSWWPLNDGVNRQRLVRTVTGLWSPSWSNGQPNTTVVNANLTAAGANASLINAWSGGLTGMAYSPALSTYTGA